MDGIQRFTGSLIGLSGKRVTLITTFYEGANTKTIVANYLIIDTVSPYNIIMGHLTINALGAVI